MGRGFTGFSFCNAFTSLVLKATIAANTAKQVINEVDFRLPIRQGLPAVSVKSFPRRVVW
jgi:hypothetical protein